MKKTAIAALCIAVSAMSASAQMSLLKEAKSFKPGGDYSAMIEKVSPMFADPETSDLAETWYVAGKAGMDNFDHFINMMRIGQQIDEVKTGQSLLQGYDFFMTALPLDSVPNEKGQVKPKYSKNIIKEIASHYNDFNVAGALLYGAKDLDGAYKAWTIYLDLPKAQFMGKDAPAAPHDTIISTIYFNRGITAWQNDKIEQALESFDQAINLNYDDPQIYLYAASLANQLGDKERQFKYAKAGYDRSGSIDDLRQMINYYLDKSDYQAAQNLVNEAIGKSTENRELATLNMLKGIIAESLNPELSKGDDTLLANYRKATELDPTLGAAFYNYGRVLYNKGNALDEASELQGPAYTKYKAEVVAPVMREAAENIEKGYELDNSLSNAVTLLQQIFYFLNDQENLERVKNL